MSTLVTGFFSSQAGAEHAVEELRRAGFSAEQLTVLLSEERPDPEVAGKRAYRAHRIAAIGAGCGAALGALAGGVAGASALGTPELPLLAAGPFLVALSGFAVGAATGAVGALVFGRGLPRRRAAFVSGETDGVLTGVFVEEDRMALARSVLDTCGAGQNAVR